MYLPIIAPYFLYKYIPSGSAEKFPELQFMLLTAGTLQNRKCTFVNVIERFAVYNTVSITDCLIIHLRASD